jgi:Phage integrase family
MRVLDGLIADAPNSTNRVFAHVTGEQVSMAFRRAAKAAKIEDFRFHDLRHTAASWLRMEGADIHTVAQLFGHQDLRCSSQRQFSSASAATVTISLRDEAGLLLQAGNLGPVVVTIPAFGHASYELSDRFNRLRASARCSVTADRDIFGLGFRVNGVGFTSLKVIAK